MNRTRRVTATVVAATGLLGAAAAAAATVTGLTADQSANKDAPASAAALSGGVGLSAAEQADAAGRTTLEDYIAAMSQRANHLGDRVTAAEARLGAARAERARLLAQVRARTAALARASEAARATVTVERSSAPATHTSTGASSGGHGDDGGDDHGDDGGGDDD